MLYNITYLTTVKLYKSLLKKGYKFISYNLIFYYTLQKKKMHNSKKNYVIFYKIYILHQADKYVSHTPYIVVFKQR